MTEAFFALAGALVGVAGTLGTEWIRGRRDDRRLRNQNLRAVCADFIAGLAHLKQLAVDLERDHERHDRRHFHERHAQVRADYERLRLLSSSVATQEAARSAMRYTFGLWRLADGREPRADEKDTPPAVLVDEWLARLYVAARVELGVDRPEEVFREPEEWLYPIRKRVTNITPD